MNLLNRMSIPHHNQTSNNSPTGTVLGETDLVVAAGKVNDGGGAHGMCLDKLE